MDPLALAGLGLAFMFLLILLHVPLGVAMGLAGVAGFAWIATWPAALSLLASETAGALASMELATIPLFILMGGFATAAGLSEDLYRMAYALVGHRRGGLAMATIGGCAGFGAVCGSSIATTATFARIALPSMRGRGYAPGFAAGTVVAGGTLGILVPPSVIMVIYAVIARELIVELYLAALVPAVLAVLLHAVAIGVQTRLDPASGPAGPRMPWRERWAVVRGCWGVALLAGTIMGGIGFGVFTATEAAAVGAAMAFCFAILRRGLSVATLRAALLETATTTGMIYVVIVGAAIFAYFVEITQAPQALVGAAQASGLQPVLLLAMILLLYLVLGAVFDEVAVMVVTLPFVLPLIKAWGYDPVWWGVINVVVIELGLMIPPIGMGVFVVHALAGGTRLTEIYRGVAPFVVSNLVRLALLVAIPGLCLWLPALLRD
jgi:tripartite ATP-independent transporter DctM subunit